MAILPADNITSLPLLQVTFRNLQTPGYWREVYASGRTGLEEALPPLLVMILARLVVVGCILLAAWLSTGLIRRMIRRAFATVTKREEREIRRLRTLEGLITSAISYLIYIIAIIPILFTIGLKWDVLLGLFAASSVVLVAVGLGSQKLVRDLVNGLFILGEGQFDVGDWITIGAVTGRVEEVGLRVTRLRDEQGRLYIIGNGDINQVFNSSRGHVRLVIDLSLQRTADLNPALQAIRELAAGVLSEHYLTIDEQTITTQLIGIDAAKLTVRLTLWAPQKLLPIIEDEIRRRLLLAQEAETLALV
jgi:small conductance mechanosensitive channel